MVYIKDMNQQAPPSRLQVQPTAKWNERVGKLHAFYGDCFFSLILPGLQNQRANAKMSGHRQFRGEDRLRWAVSSSWRVQVRGLNVHILQQYRPEHKATECLDL